MEGRNTVWKDVAWNGVRFSAPETWEIAKIGLSHFLFVEEGLPVMEIKWERIKGAFSAEAALQRLRSNHGNRVKETRIPDGWKKGIGSFDATGFTWQVQAREGTGAILYCQACRLATLIRFFQHPSCQTNGVAPWVLASYRDHGLGSGTVWSIFDIRAVIPAEFQLVGRRFDAGLFEMKFAAEGQRVTLHRWGPAAMLLGQGDLLRFAVEANLTAKALSRILICNGRDAVQGEQAIASGPWANWWNRLRGMPSFRWFRLWHVNEKNRILGVEAEGKKPFDPDVLDKICADYESL